MQFSEMHGAGYVNVNMVITKSFLIFKEIQGCFFHDVQDFQRVTQKDKGLKTRLKQLAEYLLFVPIY